MKGSILSDQEVYSHTRHLLSSVMAFSDEAWTIFQNKSRIKRINKKEHFLTSGDVCRFLGIISAGYVRHYYVVDGKEMTNDFNFEGMFTGAYHSFVHEAPARFNVIAMEDTTLVTFGKDSWELLIKTFPEWQSLNLVILEKIFHRKQLREESFLLDTPEQRYRAILDTAPHMIKRVPLQYLASYLGMASETLSRIRSNVK